LSGDSGSSSSSQSIYKSHPLSFNIFCNPYARFLSLWLWHRKAVC
jgi:hypothetical protein